MTVTESSGSIRVEPECPKCGAVYGFLYAYPRYRYTEVLGQTAWMGEQPREWLEFSCTLCGYTVTRPVKESR